MPVETFNYLDSLVPTNPQTSDSIVNGDDHIRGIKAALKATFPGVNAPMTADDGSGSFRVLAGASGYSFGAEPTLGFKRSSAGVVTFSGGVWRGNGLIPAGAIMDFAMATAPEGWLPCDGQSLAVAAEPALFAAIGYLYGGSGATFLVPNALTRFRRHRYDAGISGAVGTFASHAYGSHSHAVIGTTGNENQNHAHTGSGVTSGTPDHRHLSFEQGLLGLSNTQPLSPGNSPLTDVDYGAPFSYGIKSSGSASANVGLSSPAGGDGGRSYSFTTSGVTNFHNHNLNFATQLSGDVETRPTAWTVLTCIKL